MTGLLNSLGNLIQSWFHTFGYGGIVLAMALESCLIPLPSEIIMPVAGTFITSAAGAGLHFNLIGVTLAGAVGNVIGSAAAYWIGATGGRPFIFKYGKYILVSRHDFDMAERWFNRWGGGVAFFSRLLPIIRTYISLPAGMARMNFGKFILFTFLGALPWTFALAYAGEKLGSSFGNSIGKLLHDSDYVIGAAIVILVALYIYRHVKKEREYDAKHATQTTPPGATNDQRGQGYGQPPAARPNGYTQSSAMRPNEQRPNGYGQTPAGQPNQGTTPRGNNPAGSRPPQAQGPGRPPSYSPNAEDPNGPNAPTIKMDSVRKPPQR